MNNRFLRLLQLSSGIIDFIAINAVFLTAEYLFRHYGLISPHIQYFYFCFALNAIWLLVTMVMNIYHERNVISFEQYGKVSIQAFSYFLLIVIIELFFFRFLMLSRIFIVVVLSSFFLMILVNRVLYLMVNHYLRSSNLLISKVLVVGYNGLSKRLVDCLAEEGVNKKVVGYCEEYENVHELSSYPILSDIKGTFAVCEQHNINEIYSTISPEHNPNLYQLIQYADQHCIRFRMVPDFGVFIKRNIHVDFIREFPVLSLRKEPLTDLGNRIKKRIFDVVVSSLVIIFILSWLCPLLAILIKLGSRGPVFFAQLRSGRNNKDFYFYKFRSMRMNDRQNSTQATRKDPRVTRIGQFLRRTSLDEFPQFWNVLRGDMSIAGPRPHMIKHTYEYSALIGQYMVRHFLKPGITGWAQIKGLRGETKTLNQMQDRVAHDIWYLENWSLFLDIRIMFLTVYNTIKGDKNAF